MTEKPRLEEFRRDLLELRRHELLRKRLDGEKIVFSGFPLGELAQLLRDEIPYYFLLAAAGLNRTSLKKHASKDEAMIVSPALRKAYAVQKHLPLSMPFEHVVNRACDLRSQDFDRHHGGSIETLFRQRLLDEGIPIFMSPPRRAVPGILVTQRKPDGVSPDPSSFEPPQLYLEIKNIKRVADDIQKRLYEVAEASLEMKLLYGALELRGLNLKSTKEVILGREKVQEKLRRQITAARPVVVVMFLCSRVEAERYRSGAEALIDKVFFQEEIEECLAFLKKSLRRRWK